MGEWITICVDVEENDGQGGMKELDEESEKRGKYDA